MWQSEGAEAFSQFHLYVCSAFLVRWSHQLREMDFQVDCSSLSIHRSLLIPLSSSGHHHVPAILTNTELGGSRNRTSVVRSLRPQFNMAQCPKPFRGEIGNAKPSMIFPFVLLSDPWPTDLLFPFPPNCFSVVTTHQFVHSPHRLPSGVNSVRPVLDMRSPNEVRRRPRLVSL